MSFYRLVQSRKMISPDGATWNIEFGKTEELNGNDVMMTSSYHSPLVLDDIANRMDSNKIYHADDEACADEESIPSGGSDEAFVTKDTSISSMSEISGDRIIRCSNHRMNFSSQTSYDLAIQRLDDLLAEDAMVNDLSAWQDNVFRGSDKNIDRVYGGSTSSENMKDSDDSGDEKVQINVVVRKKDLKNNVITLKKVGGNQIYHDSMQVDEPVYAVVQKKKKRTKKLDNDTMNRKDNEIASTNTKVDKALSSYTNDNGGNSPISPSSEESLDPCEDPGYESLDSIQTSMREKLSLDTVDYAEACDDVEHDYVNIQAAPYNSKKRNKSEETDNTKLLSENIVVLNGSTLPRNNSMRNRGTPLLEKGATHDKDIRVANYKEKHPKTPTLLDAAIAGAKFNSDEGAEIKESTMRTVSSIPAKEPTKQPDDDVQINDNSTGSGGKKVKSTPIITCRRAFSLNEKNYYKRACSMKGTYRPRSSESVCGTRVDETKIVRRPVVCVWEDGIDSKSSGSRPKSSKMKKKLGITASFLRYFERSLSSTKRNPSHANTKRKEKSFVLTGVEESVVKSRWVDNSDITDIGRTHTKSVYHTNDTHILKAFKAKGLKAV